MASNYSVFLSYSHEDEIVVSGLKPLLEIQRKDLVFQDKTELVPGKKWEDAILNALDGSKAVVVFWCSHSSTSPYVKKEFERGYAQNKDIIPVLLDDTPLLSPLNEFQWIDLRRLVKHKVVNLQSSAPEQKDITRHSTPAKQYPAPKQASFRWTFLLVGIAIFIVFIIVILVSVVSTVAIICGSVALIAAAVFLMKQFTSSVKTQGQEIPSPAPSSVPSIAPQKHDVTNPFTMVAAEEIIKQLNKKIPVQNHV